MLIKVNNCKKNSTKLDFIRINFFLVYIILKIGYLRAYLNITENKFLSNKAEGVSNEKYKLFWKFYIVQV
jgi:hypothetical protein